MKTLSRNKILAAAVATMSLCSPLKTHADVGEWIANQIGDYVQSEIESAFSGITNSTNDYLGPIGSWLWESVVSSIAESNLKDSALKFADYQPDRRPLNNVGAKYAGAKLWKSYDEVYLSQKLFADNLAYSINNLPLRDIAGGAAKKPHQQAIDSIDTLQRQATPEIATAAVREYIAANQSNIFNIEDLLLGDLSANSNVATIVNTHPEVLDVYANSIGIPTLRGNARHLYHWGVTADSHLSRLPKKTKLIDGRKIEFRGTNGAVQMLYGGKTLATTTADECAIRCNDIELLNLVPFPNSQYTFNDISYTTDKLGRVVKVVQPVNASLKGKCVAKSKLKAKKSTDYLGNEFATAYYPLALLDYQAPEALINTTFYAPDSDNQAAVKGIKKAIKQQTKTKGYSFVLETELQYNDASTVPSRIIVHVGPETFVIVNPSAAIRTQQLKPHTAPDYAE